MSFALRNGDPRKLLPSRIEAARFALERSQLYEAVSRVEAVEHRRKADDMEHKANEHKRIAEELAREIADMVFELKEVDTAKMLAETKHAAEYQEFQARRARATPSNETPEQQ